MAANEDKKNDIHQRIEDILTNEFGPQHLQVINESHQHAGPAQNSHFKVTLVSECFEGQRAVGRHRTVYQALSPLMPTPVHALALHTYTVTEWQERHNSVPVSPACRGGDKSA
jgi:BolA protein